MANTTKEIRNKFRNPMSRVVYPIQADTKIWQGAGVTRDATGNVGVYLAGEILMGFAEETVDNTDGAAALAGRDVSIFSTGQMCVAVSGAVADDEGKAVFMSDDQTFTYTPTAGMYVGSVVQFDVAGYVWVELDCGNSVWTTVVTLADDAEVALPDATNGVVQVTSPAEGGLVVISTAGACVLLGGSANFAATDSDTDLCVYDNGTAASVKNRLGASAVIQISYNGAI